MGQLIEPLPPCWRPASGEVVDHLYSARRGRQEGRLRTFHLLFHNHHRIYRGSEAEEPPRLFELHAERLVAESAPGAIFVHAGAVAWKGRGILVPGASGAGKTTLVAALVAAGAEYYSDEFAVLDEAGRLLPYARAPRPKGDAVTHDRPDRVGEEPVPVSLIAFSRYQPQADPAGRGEPVRLSPGETVIELMRHTPSARSRPQEVLEVLHRVAEDCVGWRGERGNAEDAARALLRSFEGSVDSAEYDRATNAEPLPV